VEHLELHKDGFTISTNKSKLDIQAIHEYLSERSYWAEGRSRAIMETSISNSLCFGVFAADGSQAGFARVVTDLATFGWICDLFILGPYRGKGLGKWLIATIVKHPHLKTMRLLILATRDAHGLYRDYGGFTPLQNADRWMARSAEIAAPGPTDQSS
jgi:GNAT superfamily N-acetyltransferase